MTPFKLPYRPDIDGLRAMAVVAVVLYHASLGVPGGFIGVDVFFVISGYLITSLIVADLAGGRFSFLRFWERRIRRIFPALFVMIIVVLGAGLFLLLPEAYRDLADSALWQAVFAANVFFWKTTGYFGGAAEEKPLLHTWSLAIEEQFYFVIPFLIFWLWRLSARRHRAVAVVLLAIVVASFAYAVYAVARFPASAFYLLPSRAWELGLGAGLAVVPSRFHCRHGTLAVIAAWIGLALIAAPAFLYSSSTPFPGLAALPPCLGTALIIWAGTAKATQNSPLSARWWLSLRPVVSVGLISYSLYLWHWPVIAFARYWEIHGPLPWYWRLALVVTGTALAMLSYHYVEQPFRQRRVCATRRGIFAFGGAAIVLSAVMAAAVVVTGGAAFRFGPEIRNLYADAGDFFTTAVKPADVAADRLPRVGTPEADVEVLIWGDSHAQALVPAFDRALKDLRISGAVATHPATPPVLGFYTEHGDSLGRRNLEFGENILRYTERHNVHTVFLVANWDFHFAQAGFPASTDLTTQLAETVRTLRARGISTFVVLKVPGHKVDARKALAAIALRGGQESDYAAAPSAEATLPGYQTDFIAAITDNGGTVVDLRPLLLDPQTGRYRLGENGYSLYHDATHLSPYGARSIAAPLIKKLIGNNQSAR